MINVEKIINIKVKEAFFFSFISSYQNLSWSDIMSGAKLFLNQNLNRNFNSVFHNKEDISLLENLGFDFNYKDIYGNNFIHYMIKSSSLDCYLNDFFGKESKYYFLDNAFDYVATKCNVYEKNDSNEQILTHYIRSSFYNKSMDNLQDLLKRFPDFDFKIKNSRGQNLLHQAILSVANIAIIDYLIKHSQIDICEKDNQGNTLLEVFFLHNKNKNSVILFDKLISNIDISEKRSENSILYYWIDNLIKENNVDKTTEWLSHLFNKIINKEFYYNKGSLKRLLDTLEETKDVFNNMKKEKLSLIYNEAKSSVLYLILNETLQESNVSKVKPNKI